jgi:hypothetical protein
MNETSYTPGYVAAKRAMVALGLVLLAVGVMQLWQPVRLLASGEWARAEAIRVVKEKPGLPPRVLTDGAQVLAELESRDRSYVFWNEFQVLRKDGTPVIVRANVGSQLQPLYPLTDSDGLPTSDLVCYDPADPTRVVFPLIITTWLSAGGLAIAGLALAAIGGILLHWSRRPIELPHIATDPDDGAASPTRS